LSHCTAAPLAKPVPAMVEEPAPLPATELTAGRDGLVTSRQPKQVVEVGPCVTTTSYFSGAARVRVALTVRELPSVLADATVAAIGVTSFS
jgi:hypothetical protein